LGACARLKGDTRPLFSGCGQPPSATIGAIICLCFTKRMGHDPLERNKMHSGERFALCAVDPDELDE
jgi:hypothetical protein